MKMKFSGAVAAIAIAAMVAFNLNFNSETSKTSALTMDNIEALASGESILGCFAGGVGSNACSIDAGIEILGVGIAGGCSVSCNQGYYACCSMTCTCVKT